MIESCCNHWKFDRLFFLSVALTHYGELLWLRRSHRTWGVLYIFQKIRERKRERDLTFVSLPRLNHLLFFFLFSSVTHLFSAPFLHIFPSSSSSFLHHHFSLFFCLQTEHTKKFIGGGGKPAEVKRVNGFPSASPIILYGRCSGRAFITLNYTLWLLPLPLVYADLPWPYHLIILPRRNITHPAMDI